MTEDERKIEQYLTEVESYLAGPEAERKMAVTELYTHLAVASEAGELDRAIQRLGSPKAAAAAMTREHGRPLAAMGDRLAAAILDNLPLVAVGIALVIQALVAQGTVVGAFPPFVYVEFGPACVALAPVCGVYNGGLLYAVGIPVALAWSILGLAVVESRTGTTPGKRRLGLYVVGEDGTRIRLDTAILRRLSFLAGAFAWADWAPVLWGDRQRVLDKVTATRVVVSRGGSDSSTREEAPG